MYILVNWCPEPSVVQGATETIDGRKSGSEGQLLLSKSIYLVQ